MATIYILTCLLLLSIVSLINGEEPDPSCLQCICQASSNCDTINLKCPTGSGFDSYCGPYQISRYYWEDGNGIGYDFETCTNLKACAERVVINYMKKYARDCNGDGFIDCLDYAAIHRMGADRCSDQSLYSSDYWQTFSQTQCVVNPSLEAAPQSPSVYAYQQQDQQQDQQQQSTHLYVPKSYPENYNSYNPVNSVGIISSSSQPSSSPSSSSTRRLKKKNPRRKKNQTNRGSSSRRRTNQSANRRGNQGPVGIYPVPSNYPVPVDKPEPPSTRSAGNTPSNRRIDSDDIPGAESGYGISRAPYVPSYKPSTSGPTLVSVPPRSPTPEEGYVDEERSFSVLKPPHTPRTISSYPSSPFDHSPLTPSYSPSYPSSYPPVLQPTVSSSPRTPNLPPIPTSISSLPPSVAATIPSISHSVPSSRPSRPTSRSSTRPASRSSSRPSVDPSFHSSSASRPSTNPPSIPSSFSPPVESSPLLPPPSYPPPYSPSSDSSSAPSEQPLYPASYPRSELPSEPPSYSPSYHPSYPSNESPISSPPSSFSTAIPTRSHPTTDANRRKPPNTRRISNSRNRPTITNQPTIPTQPSTIKPPVIIYETSPTSPPVQPTTTTVTYNQPETLRPTTPRSSVQPSRGVRNGRRRPTDGPPTPTLNSNYPTNSNPPRTFTQPPQSTTSAVTEVAINYPRVSTRENEPTENANPSTLSTSRVLTDNDNPNPDFSSTEGSSTSSPVPTLGFRSDFDSSTNNEDSILPSNPRPPHLTNTTITVSDQCLSCLCESTESCSNKGTCSNPEGPCGPLQVTYGQWLIAGKPKTNFQKCAASLDCSRGILRRYYAKHGVDCNHDSDVNCVDFALIHKYGLDNCKVIPDDLFKSGYWLNFENCYGFDRK